MRHSGVVCCLLFSSLVSIGLLTAYQSIFHRFSSELKKSVSSRVAAARRNLIRFSYGAASLHAAPKLESTTEEELI